MNLFHQILKEYWGYTAFRPLQESIVQKAYGSEDVLALMPTGGGKSITFQVPALAKSGICLVITPLIALMKDQVENLKKRGIKALSVHSGMTAHEMDVALDNAAYGDYKFLYLSPERLGTELFRARVQKMNVNLIAVDEAHCISQWGYDFRPSYLQIAAIRELLPEAPMLALTATATPEVAQDIMEKLKFKAPNLLQKSFERKNLVYVVRRTENKQKELLKICRSILGTAIVYVRNRKTTQEIAALLIKNGISADFYHAGLSAEQRSAKQDDWKQGRIRVVVCTNAFGMGIDKPDVRLVVHIDLPESIEAYFQEAGRGGRDEKTSYAVLLCNEADKISLQQRFKVAFPPMETIRKVYQNVYSFYNYPYGAGKGVTHDFSLMDFAQRYHTHSLTAYSALQCLQRDGYLEVTDELNNPTRIMFTIHRDELYKIQVTNTDLDRFIKILLRIYPGLFSNYTGIDETYVARIAELPLNTVCDYLLRLAKRHVIAYIPRKRTPLIIFNEERLDEKNLRISKESYQLRMERYDQRMAAMLQYAQSATKCRSRQLLDYFGETDSLPCGRCDVCTAKNALDMSSYEFEKIISAVKKIINENEVTIEQCVDAIKGENSKTLKALRWLIENEKVHEANDGKLRWGK